MKICHHALIQPTSPNNSLNPRPVILTAYMTFELPWESGQFKVKYGQVGDSLGMRLPISMTKQMMFPIHSNYHVFTTYVKVQSYLPLSPPLVHKQCFQYSVHKAAWPKATTDQLCVTITLTTGFACRRTGINFKYFHISPCANRYTVVMVSTSEWLVQYHGILHFSVPYILSSEY